jgi:hypothetical protein
MVSHDDNAEELARAGRYARDVADLLPVDPEAERIVGELLGKVQRGPGRVLFRRPI